MFRIKQVVKEPLVRVLHRFGYVALQSAHLDTLPLAKHLAKLFEKRGVDCVFDVGANLGQYVRFLRQEVGYKGRIVSVEPVRQHFEFLKTASKDDPNWTIVKAALGAQAGRQKIKITRSGVFSSFLTPSTKKSRTFASSNEIIGTEEVPVLTLEEIFLGDSACRSSTLYLKMDTQGYDLEVLKGAGRALENIVALQCEMSVQPLYESMPDYTQAAAAIQALGFVPSGMFPVSVDSDMALIEFDGIFVLPPTQGVVQLKEIRSWAPALGGEAEILGA